MTPRGTHARAQREDSSGTIRGRSADEQIVFFEEMDHAKCVRKAVRKAIVNAEYEAILERLQFELVTWQDYVKARGEKVVILFEGRDAAGKGGCISRITDVLSARQCKVVALSAPTEEEKTQWYFQKYVAHLPSAGQIVLFDRSWYNRSGVERVMGFATAEQVEQFEKEVNTFEKMLVDSGITLIKLWFDVSDEEQERRFKDRLERSEKRWKLSPMDLFARSKFYEYSKARDLMFENTSETVPWSIIPADDKRVARLNAIQHILGSVDYHIVASEELKLPKIQEKPNDYHDRDLRELDPKKARVVPQVYTVESLSVRDIDGKTWEEIAKDADKRVKKTLSVDDDADPR
ncbi:polyphosphate kinase 2-domain-containing protein [Ostreococcus tauri]|uniref:Polyphosphate kinase 2-domain-containing protein n=1 Tax=Ostreococcus tauri TaxID=70448 RepID=A0A1Y5IKK2_OSTTA|nr:polyphosphate kinase 2-domain-containing protein [Ostreococcus tauri]